MKAHACRSIRYEYGREGIGLLSTVTSHNQEYFICCSIVVFCQYSIFIIEIKGDDNVMC